MQQRRGTAAQWTAANPILAAGEIGFETDTNKFKMGNGSSTWAALQYFANAAELAAIIDGAPDLLNTLNELAEAIGEDPTFFTTVASNLSAHSSDTTSVHGIANTANLATITALDTAKTQAVADAATAADTALLAHKNDTTDIHGIADTSLLATTAYVGTEINNALSAEVTDRDTAISDHNSDQTNVHGIVNTADLALKSEVADVQDALNDEVTNRGAAISAHNSDTTDVHGIADTASIAMLSDLSAHAGDTTDVHGIPDTSLLVTTADLASAISGATVDQTALAGVGIDWNTLTEQFDIDSTVATKQYADDAVGTHNSDTTSVHGIADTSLLALKSEVAAVTASSLGLGNVDNTSDANKPVSTATETAIATAKAEAIAEVTAVIDSAPTALNTLNELAAALGDDENFAATVTTNLGLKVDSLTPIVQKTASYTLSSLTERDDLIEMGSSSALTLTIPTNATIAYPVGTSIDVLQTGTGQVTIAGASGVTVNATPGLKLRTQWSSATLFKRAENTWVVYGDLTA